MSNPSEPRAHYDDRLAALRSERDSLASRDSLLSRLRLFTMLVFVLTAWAVFDPDRLALGWLALPAAAFVALVVLHERVARRTRRVRRGITFYEHGVARLDDAWAGLGPDGSDFGGRDHPYAADLDLFGEGSLFQLLCTARTSAGRRRLAGWLLGPAAPEEIRQRQEAVAELAPKLALREDLAVQGERIDAHGHPEALERWARAEPQLQNPTRLQWLAAAFVAFSAATAVGWLAGIHSRSPFLLALTAQAAYAAWLRPRVNRIIEAVAPMHRELQLLRGVLERLEHESFESPSLRARIAALLNDGRPAATEIGRLTRLVDLLDARLNQAFAIVGALMLWSTQFAASIERWRQRHAAAVTTWVDAVAEFEALDSLASYRFEHPDDPFPEIVAGQARYEGRALGHPLLPAAECVRNDVELGPETQALLVSGSNMSGKSTLMRTVGINAVLALAGAPVRAEALRVSPLQVGGSIRVRDSLRHGMSGFYAEIHRFRDLLDLAEGALPVLFLLEEILHTTNSHDRRTGAAALLRSLLRRGAIGLVTTHDLAITRLADEIPACRNVHFADRLEDGEIRFDYRLRDGVVERTNAVDLMREIGLEV